KIKKKDIQGQLHLLNQLIDALNFLNCEYQRALDMKVIMEPRWKQAMNSFIGKFLGHSSSFHKIIEGYNISSSYYNRTINFVDIPSALVLLRSSFEALLMFHYLYVNLKDEAERTFRYHCWLYSSLLRDQALDENLVSS